MRSLSCWHLARARAAVSIRPCETVDDMAALAAFRPGLVVEAAGAQAVRDYGPACLRAGIPLLLSSVGALHDDALRMSLIEAAQDGGTRLYLPSGALAGLDYLRAIRGAREARVAYQSRKPPAAWRDELARLGSASEPTTPVTLFEGDAQEAAARYPANLNVAATLALAGVGFERTRVEVVVDPSARGNTHSVSVTSEYGTLRLTVENRPLTRQSERPRGSSAALSWRPSISTSRRSSCSEPSRLDPCPGGSVLTCLQVKRRVTA